MTRPLFIPRPAAEPTDAETTDSADMFASSDGVSPAERLRRWAELIASGETPLPADLALEELRTVLREVGRLRRERLVRLIARALAQDLHRNPER